MDFKEAARHEAFAVPISLFNTDKTMRMGTKSALVDPMLKSANVVKLQSVKPYPVEDSHHAIDVMYLVNSINFRENIKDFKTFCDIFCKIVFSMPSERIDALCDRYDTLSPKEGMRKSRSHKVVQKQNASTKKLKKTAVERIVTPETEFPKKEEDFKLFLSLNQNKKSLQLLIGQTLLEKAPPDRTIVVSGAFEDTTEVRSNKLTPAELKELQCDHDEADTRLVLHVVKSKKKRSILICNDTDILISTLANISKIKDKEVYMKRSSHEFIDITHLGHELISKKNINLESLSIMYAMTGSDQTSFIYNIGKPKAWSKYLEWHVSSQNNMFKMKELCSRAQL